MRTIQVVIEESLLAAADRAVRRLKVNRSALIRDALRQHLVRLARATRESQDREGYRRHPQGADELSAWDGAAAWPED